MYYRSGTDGIAAYMYLCSIYFVFSYNGRIVLCCMKRRYGRQFEIMTSNQKTDSVSRSISSRSDLKQRSHRLSREMTSWPSYWKNDVIRQSMCTVHLHKEQSCQISSWSDLKPGILRHFLRRSPQQEQQQQEWAATMQPQINQFLT